MLYRRLFRQIDPRTKELDHLNKKKHWRNPDTHAEIKKRRRNLRDKFDLIRRWDPNAYREYFIQITMQLLRRSPEINTLPRTMVTRLTHAAMFMEMQKWSRKVLAHRDAKTWYEIIRSELARRRRP